MLLFSFFSTTPSAFAQVHVEYEGSSTSPQLRLTEMGSNDFTRIFFDNDNSSDRWALSGRIVNSDDHVFGFYYNGLPRMVYNQTNGGLGIGTTQPEDLLHVANGDIRISNTNPRLNLVTNSSSGIATIGFMDNLGTIADATITYTPATNVLDLTTLSTAGVITMPRKVGINESSNLEAQLTIKANAGNATTPATLELVENNNSGYALLKYSNSTEDGHFTVDANTQYGNFAAGDADYRIQFSEDGNIFHNILTAMYAYDNQDGDAVNAKDERIGIRTETPTADLHLVHKSGISGHGFKIENESSNNYWRFYVSAANGDLLLRNDANPGSNVGTFAQNGNYTASDMRLKKGIEKMPYGLEEVMKMDTKIYQYKNQTSSEAKSIGFLAQDIQTIVPELVLYSTEVDQYSLNYAAVSVLAIQAVKELNVKIEQQKTENDYLKTELAALKKMVLTLKTAQQR